MESVSNVLPSFCLLLAMVSAQTEVPVHVHRTQQLGAVCKVSLGSSVSPPFTHQPPSTFHPSTSLHLPPINLPPSSIHQSLSTFHPSTSLHLPHHQSLSTFHPSIFLHLPSINLPLSPNQLSLFPNHQSHSTSKYLLPSVSLGFPFIVPVNTCMCYLSCLPPPPPQVLSRWSAGGIGWGRQGCQVVGQANEGMCTHIL